jgi:hypothetical protein
MRVFRAYLPYISSSVLIPESTKDHTDPASGIHRQSASYGSFGDELVSENPGYPETIGLMDLFTTTFPESFDRS